MKTYIDEDIKNLIIECLEQARSYYGRTIEQAWDDVPLEDWEHSAIIILSHLKKTNNKQKEQKIVIKPNEINVKRMLSYDE